MNFLFRLLFVFTIMAGSPSHAQDLVGTVTRVQDGDTISILTTDGRKFTVRLAEIDTPEKGQPFADQSRRALSGLVLRKPVRIKITDVDRYRRLVGRVQLGPTDVNLLMVQRGMAWANLPYITDQRFLIAEREARIKKLGLWALPAASRVPPWEQRAKSKAAPAPVLRAPTAPLGLFGTGNSSAWKCGERRRCTEMRSCEEARFHLRQCGVSSLDKDGDGIPCESLCR